MPDKLSPALQKFDRRARADKWNYLGAVITLVALAWVIQILIQAAQRGSFSTILSSSFAVVGLLLPIFILGYTIYRGSTQGIWPLINDYSFGSYIDQECEELVWWAGSDTGRLSRIPLSQIATIKHVINSDMDNLILLDGDGNKIAFNDRGVANKMQWADAMVAAFPTIRLDRD